MNSEEDILNKGDEAMKKRRNFKEIDRELELRKERVLQSIYFQPGFWNYKEVGHDEKKKEPGTGWQRNRTDKGKVVEENVQPAKRFLIGD